MCESFQCLPHEAVRALENDPDHLISKVLGLRAFAGAWRSYRDNGMRDVGKNPLIETVKNIDFDDYEEHRRRKNEGEGT
ncbi:MAG: hypothetical protein V3U85_01175 [Hyphomicrobium sp.]